MRSGVRDRIADGAVSEREAAVCWSRPVGERHHGRRALLRGRGEDGMSSQERPGHQVCQAWLLLAEAVVSPANSPIARSACDDADDLSVVSIVVEWGSLRRAQRLIGASHFVSVVDLRCWCRDRGRSWWRAGVGRG